MMLHLAEIKRLEAENAALREELETVKVERDVAMKRLDEFVDYFNSDSDLWKEQRAELQAAQEQIAALRAALDKAQHEQVRPR